MVGPLYLLQVVSCGVATFFMLRLPCMFLRLITAIFVAIRRIREDTTETWWCNFAFLYRFMNYFCNVLRSNLCVDCKRARTIRRIVRFLIIRSRMCRNETLFACRVLSLDVIITFIFTTRGRCHFNDRTLRNVPTKISVHHF